MVPSHVPFKGQLVLHRQINFTTIRAPCRNVPESTIHEEAGMTCELSPPHRSVQQYPAQREEPGVTQQHFLKWLAY